MIKAIRWPWPSALPYFFAVTCAEDFASKPDPAMLNALMGQAEVSAARAVMVGDSHLDIDMANAAHTDAIWANYTNLHGSALSGATAIITQVSDIINHA